MMLNEKDQSLINSLIYTDMNKESPTRHEMIKYSTWRIYLYNELEAIPPDRRDVKRSIETYSKQFPQIVISSQRKQFYDFVYKPTEQTDKDYKEDCRNDNISHFICRMLYCQEQNEHSTFIEMEKRILEARLRRILRDSNTFDRENLMDKMKKIIIVLKGKDNLNCYNVPQQEWVNMKDLISFNVLVSLRKQQYPRLYAKLPFEEAEAAIRRRRSFIRNGYVYVNTQSMIDIVLANYQQHLRKKLNDLRPKIQDLIVQDSENQFSSFLLTTIKQINEQGIDDTKMNGKYNLTLKNIDSLNKYFPPCMLHLNQQLKIHRHLKHDGRRQLWGFFKACGMEVHDNREYFRKYLEGKVTASQMKTHMYNIEHAYGMQGKRKAQGAWKCRSIITGTAPKKGEHHGCPFYHWREEELGEFIRKNYRVTEQKLKQIMHEKQLKHFQVACGRLFESAEVNQHDTSIPPQITAKLGRAPFLYYEAGMQLREKKLKQTQGKDQKTTSKNNSIQF